MTKVATAVKGDHVCRKPAPPRSESSPPQPGWVHVLIIRVLAGADCALSPHDVHSRAELVHGQRISRSSIRNALRIASLENDAAIQRVGYGSYRLRSRPVS
jgi:hypothetical protein